jgi:hypothetical protein
VQQQDELAVQVDAVRAQHLHGAQGERCSQFKQPFRRADLYDEGTFVDAARVTVTIAIMSGGNASPHCQLRP